MFDAEETKNPPRREEIFGLATLAGHAGTRRDLRIKAIRALARIHDQNAIRVLGEMALWEEDEELRTEVTRSLEATFGDDLPEVLEGIRRELTGIWVAGGDDEEDEEEAAEAVLPELGGYDPAPREWQPSLNQPSREEGAPLWLLWVVVGIVVVGGLVILMVMR